MSKYGLWYFAHPYTCKDADGQYVPAGEEANFRICCIRSGRLMEAGYNIYSPIAHTHPIHVSSPTFLACHEHQTWYELDNEFMDRTEWSGIIMAPGWPHSKGCVAERDQFVARGLPIKFYQDIVEGD